MRPVPWLWVIRFVAVAGAVVTQDLTDPRTQWWQLLLVGLAVALGLEWLQDGYKRAQRQLRPVVRCAACDRKTDHVCPATVPEVPAAHVHLHPGDVMHGREL